jgi:hypothetical protein
MEDFFFIIVGIDSNHKEYWVRNTDPIVWSDDKTDSKKYVSVVDADIDIKSNKDTFKLILNSSSMEKIDVYKMDKDWNRLKVYAGLNKRSML